MLSSSACQTLKQFQYGWLATGGGASEAVRATAGALGRGRWHFCRNDVRHAIRELRVPTVHHCQRSSYNAWVADLLAAGATLQNALKSATGIASLYQL